MRYQQRTTWEIHQMSISELTQFFGLCSLINFGVLILSTIMLVVLRDPISKIHSRLMGVPASDLARQYFQYLAFYKIAIFVFNLVPYIALKIMS